MMLAYRSSHVKRNKKLPALKVVPKLLNFEKIQRCMDNAQEMLTMFNDDPDLLEKVGTGPRLLRLLPKSETDENKAFCYD